MPTTLKFHPKAFSLATLLAAHGWRKRSLSGSGAIGAFLVGYVISGSSDLLVIVRDSERLDEES
jgi:uncharacterized membrane protein